MIWHRTERNTGDAISRELPYSTGAPATCKGFFAVLSSMSSRLHCCVHTPVWQRTQKHALKDTTTNAARLALSERSYKGVCKRSTKRFHSIPHNYVSGRVEEIAYCRDRQRTLSHSHRTPVGKQLVCSAGKVDHTPVSTFASVQCSPSNLCILCMHLLNKKTKTRHACRLPPKARTRREGESSMCLSTRSET